MLSPWVPITLSVHSSGYLFTDEKGRAVLTHVEISFASSGGVAYSLLLFDQFNVIRKTSPMHNISSLFSFIDATKKLKILVFIGEAYYE